jgi:hypothetical protein
VPVSFSQFASEFFVLGTWGELQIAFDGFVLLQSAWEINPVATKVSEHLANLYGVKHPMAKMPLPGILDANE